MTTICTEVKYDDALVQMYGCYVDYKILGGYKNEFSQTKTSPIFYKIAGNEFYRARFLNRCYFLLPDWKHCIQHDDRDIFKNRVQQLFKKSKYAIPMCIGMNSVFSRESAFDLIMKDMTIFVEEQNGNNESINSLRDSIKEDIRAKMTPNNVQNTVQNNVQYYTGQNNVQYTTTCQDISGFMDELSTLDNDMSNYNNDVARLNACIDEIVKKYIENDSEFKTWLYDANLQQAQDKPHAHYQSPNDNNELQQNDNNNEHFQNMRMIEQFILWKLDGNEYDIAWIKCLKGIRNLIRSITNLTGGKGKASIHTTLGNPKNFQRRLNGNAIVKDWEKDAMNGFLLIRGHKNNDNNLNQALYKLSYAYNKAIKAKASNIDLARLCLWKGISIQEHKDDAYIANGGSENHNKKAIVLYNTGLNHVSKSNDPSTPSVKMSLYNSLGVAYQGEKKCKVSARFYQKAIDVYHATSPDVQNTLKTIKTKIDNNMLYLKSCNPI